MKTRLRSILERAVSYGLVVIAFFGFLYFQEYVGKSQKASLGKKADDLMKLKLQIDGAKKSFAARQTQIDGINKQVESRMLELERFEKLLGRTASYTLFIDQVQRKAQSVGINILNSKYERPTPAPGTPGNYLEFRFAMGVTGPYEKMKHFLWELENSMGRLTKISNLVVKPPICDKDGNMNLTLTVKTYFIQ